MQWRSFAFVAVACWVLWPSVGMGQANPVDDLARFKLYADCAPMRVFVYAWDSDSQALGLTEESVEAAVESRLRSARLYSDASPYVLSVDFVVFDDAFKLDLQFYKLVTDAFGSVARLAPTWSIEGAGIHGGQPGYIRSAVAEYVDQFLVEYLRVNEAACG